ncbi:CS1 type fimbrial major subunit [Citrobacter sp. S-77]|uniref:CS1 type fimbrial major subunit n=1 Tax=Citrobacter sp. S-77 TaxID=1080067 RepID=UPI0005EE3FC5|nr:CS1 type fimbrial major subunit [Citrobacter sp. S-77]
MNLKKTVGAFVLTALFASMGASAVEKTITVTASVDPTLDLLQSNGDALPTSVALEYSPAEKKFKRYTLNTAVHTNAADKGVVVRLAGEAKLTNVMDSSDNIPIDVSWAGQTLSTSDTTVAADDLDFGATGVSGVSASQELVIHAKVDSNKLPNAGNYQGVVTIVLTQST